MEFKLNEYRQGVTDEQLINDVIHVASSFGDKYLSYSLYKTKGKYSQNTFNSHFGSWLTVLERAGLRTVRNAEDMKRISDQDMIDDIRKIAKKLSAETVTSLQYSELGGYAFPTILERFGSWSSALDKAHLSPTNHVTRVEDIDLFIEIERIWISLGKQPTTTEMKKGISKYSLDTFMRRFGGWRGALLAFVEYVNSPSSEDESQPKTVDAVSEQSTSSSPKDSKPVFVKRTPRSINLKIRFHVLSRDNFTCKACGRSPAKEPGVELHVDHIVPWSRGGETELNNLQTLCSKCNLGKSDNEFA